MKQSKDFTIQEITRENHDIDNILNQVANIWINTQKTTFLPLIQTINPDVFQSMNTSPTLLSVERLTRVLHARLKNGFRLAVAYDKNHTKDHTEDNKILGYILFTSLQHSVDLELFMDRVFSGKQHELSDDDIARIKQAYSTSELYVEELMIHSSAQRCGLGSALLEFVFSWGRKHGYETCALSCLEHNDRACTFYEKLGFEKQESFVNNDTLSALVFKKHNL